MSRTNVISRSTALLICIAATAAAEESQSESTFEPHWSVGAGIAFDTFPPFPSSLAGLSSSICGTSDGGSCIVIGNNASPIPFGKFGFDYHIIKPLAVFFGLDGSYMKSDKPYDEERYSIGLNVGARWILNPGGVVEVSPYAALRGRWLWDNVYNIFDSEYNYHAYRVGLELGLVLEHKLTESLSLRIASSLAEFGYARTEVGYDDETPHFARSTNTTYATLVFTPSLELRLSF